MNKIRIGKDIKILLKVMTNGESISLEGRNLELHLRNPFGDVSVIPHSVRGDVMEARFGGAEQKYCGVYTLTIWENKGGVDSTALDFEKAFELVSSTSLETPRAESLETEEVIKLSGDMSVGVQGASAYEIAVANGFKGTEAEWLESLKLHYADLTAEEKAELQKPITDIAAGVAEGERQRQQAEEIRKSAEVGRLGEEEKRVASEIERKTAEEARVTAEAERVSAEAERTESEALRTESEQNRASAEVLRTESEVLRTTAESQRSEAEVQRMTNEDLRKVAEQSRATAEQARVNAEAERANAESLRASEEGVRVASEGERKTAESARVSAEQQRNTAEQARATAEEKRQQQTTEAIEATKSATASAVTATAEAVKATSDAKNATTGANEAASKADVAAQGIDGKIGDIRETIDTMRQEGNALLGDVATGKKLIAEAVTKKGVYTPNNATFQQMADNVGQIKRGDIDLMFTVLIDDTMPSPEVQRIGGPEFPNQLESLIYAQTVIDGKRNYLLSKDDLNFKATGEKAVLDGSEGDVMTVLPAFWYAITPTMNGMEIKYSLTMQGAGWTKSPEMWVGCTEMVCENKNGRMIAHSCYNTTPEYRGGNQNNNAWDELEKSQLGMPRTGMSHDAMRAACKNKGVFVEGVYHNFDHRLQVKVLLMFMAVYGTRDIQAPWSGIDPKTNDEVRNEEGFKFGGLGEGVIRTSFNWSQFNGYNPLIPAGTTFACGVRNRVVTYRHVINKTEGITEEFKVPSLWGMCNYFGHIWTAIDGMTKENYIDSVTQTKMERYGLWDVPSNYVSSGTGKANKVIEQPIVSGGFIKKMSADFIPVVCGGSESSYYCDQMFWTSGITKLSLWHGGSAGYGRSGGLCALVANFGVGVAYANCGGRLVFSPS